MALLWLLLLRQNLITNYCDWRASKIRSVLHIFDWLIFHYFLLLIFRLTPLTSASKRNVKLVKQKLCSYLGCPLVVTFFGSGDNFTHSILGNTNPLALCDKNIPLWFLMWLFQLTFHPIFLDESWQKLSLFEYKYFCFVQSACQIVFS